MSPSHVRGPEAFRDTVRAHFGQLQDLLPAIALETKSAIERARLVVDILSKSADAVGFEVVVRGGELVKRANDETVHARVTGFVDVLTDVLEGGTGSGSSVNGWIVHAGAPYPPEHEAELPDLASEMSAPSAWRRAGELLDLTPDELAERLALRLGVPIADLSQPSTLAARLVPVSLVEAGPLLPLREDGVSFVAAAANPTSLSLIGALERVTGRDVQLEIAPPQPLSEAVRALVGAGPGAAPGARPLEPPKEPCAVLVVDDDPSVKRMVSWILEAEGFDVVVASDGAEAMERLEDGTEVDFMILDLNMPRMDGKEVLRRVRGSGRTLPILVLTGAGGSETEAEVIEGGADDYLRKPFDPRILLARLRAIHRRMRPAP